MDSILNSTKKLLGVVEEDTNFDADIIMHINSVFLTLNQIGVGPSRGFMIEDKTAYWEDFVTDIGLLNAVKPYMYLKVKLVFDPPLSSSVIEAINRQIAEFEWRLRLAAENAGEEEIQNG